MFDDKSPIYLQIADAIRNAVVTGELASDAQVMSTNQYAAFYRINPATAAKGFQLLVDQGVLYKKRGIGMFVSPDARDTLLRDRRSEFFAQRVEPMVAEADILGISRDEIVDRVRSFRATQAHATTHSEGDDR